MTNALEGKLVWNVGAEYGDYPAVVVRDGLVYGVSVEGGSCALDLETGAERWRFATAGYGPTVTDDAVYFASRRELLAVPRTGAEALWRAPLPGPVVQAPTVTDTLVLVRTIDGALLALDRATGVVRWSGTYAGHGLDLCRPVLLGDRVAVGGDAGLTVVELATGALVAAVETKSVGVLHDDGRALYSFHAGRLDFFVHDRESYEVVRTVRLDPELAGDVFNAASIVVDGVLYSASSADGEVTYVDLQLDAPRVTKLGIKSKGPVVIDRGLAYLTPAGSLCVVDLERRAVAWTAAIKTRGQVGPPVLSDDLVIVPSEGCVLAIRRP